MERNRVLIFGGASLVGSHLVAGLAGEGELLTAGRTDPRSLGLPVDRHFHVPSFDEPSVRRVVREAAPNAVVNFVARTDVDGCEKERSSADAAPRPDAPPDSAVTLNALLPKWLAEECGALSSVMIHLSTDYVFDGSRGPYPETARPDPFGEHLSWYGYTKGWGERGVREADPKATILRIAHPYRARFPRKLDFARTIIERSAAGTLPPLYTDQVISPTWIPDVTRSIRRLLGSPLPGVVHLASPTTTSPYEFGRVTLESVGGDPSAIRPSTMGSGPPAPGRAPRPLRGGLAVERALAWDIGPTDFRVGLRELARELSPPGEDAGESSRRHR